MQLLAVACLSLAAKVDETEVPVSLDLQVEILFCYVLFYFHCLVPTETMHYWSCMC